MTPGLRSHSIRPHLLGILLVALLFWLAQRDTLALLTDYWASNDMYSYGFLVPVISGLMFWSRRHELASTAIAPSLVAGCLVSLVGLATLQFGRASATNLIQEISVFVTIVGLTLLLMGWRFLRRFWFPVAYLLAMIPFWDVLTRGVQPFFQVYSAAVGVWLLQLVGIPVLRQGSFIELPNVRLEVAEACSGINHLIAVMCIGVPATLLFVSTWAKRLFILACAVGIALVSNGIRVAVVSVFAYKGILAPNGDIHGPYALFRSLLISGIGFLVLFALITWLSDREAPWRHGPASAEPGGGPASSVAVRIQPGAMLVVVLLLCTSLAFQQWRRGVSVLPGRSLASFPATVGPWESRGPGPFGAAFEAVRFDDRLSLDYATPDGRALNLRVGYFRNQAQGKKLGGWDMAKIFEARNQPVHTIEYGGIRAKDFTETGPAGRRHVTYWYSVGRTAVEQDYQVRLLTGFRSLFLGKSNGALIVVTRQLGESESLEKSRAVVRGFIEPLVPVIGLYFPQT
jgi:EpsI family protein